MPAVPSYQVIEGWEKRPAHITHSDTDGVAVDSKDRVYMLTRRDAHMLVYEPDGTFVTSWGENVFTQRTHGLFIDKDDFVYTTDDGDHTVRKFTTSGQLLMTLGTPGVASDTGYDGRSTASIKRVGPPFNRPTKAVVAPNGDIYVSDGYGNTRIHRFSPDGILKQSWGEVGQFAVAHGIWADPDGRIMVADRENDRIHIFTPDGELTEMWDNVQRPTDIFIDKEGLVYVTSLWWTGGSNDLMGRFHKYDLPGAVSVLDLKGNLLLRWCSADRAAPGNFVGPHCVCTDSKGDMYIGEVAWTVGVQRGFVPPGTHDFQKFARK
jgi:streptogramin lyase